MNGVTFVSVNFLTLAEDMEFSNENNEGNKHGYPYKLARIVNGVRKYIVFYVWDANTNQLSRQRRIITDKKTAKEQIKEIDFHLINGFHIQKKKPVLDELRTLDAFKEVIEIRKRELSEASSTRDKSHSKQFFEYLEKNNLEDLLLKNLTKLHIIKFLDARKADGVGNRTRNNALNWVRSILSVLVDRGYIENNVAKGISNLKEIEALSIAFTKEDSNRLKEILKKENYVVYQFCMIMYLCFIRPKELRSLKVEHIKLEEKQTKIFIPSTISKSKKNRYVVVPTKLKPILEELVKDKKPQDLLFKRYGKMYPKNYFNQEFKKVVKKYGFNQQYYLYCWKHTGVTEAMNNGAKLTFIQMQCGHSSIEDTALYVKGLGLATEDTNWDFFPDI